MVRGGGGEVRREEEMIEILRRIEKSLRQEEGFFIYASKTYLPDIETLLKKIGVNYDVFKTMMVDLYEIQLKLNQQQAQIFEEIKAYIYNIGIPVHVSRIRLPMTGMITNITYSVKENDYDYITIELTQERTDEEFLVAGSYMKVIHLDADTGMVYIKFNSVNKPAIRLKEGAVFEIEFERFYITNSYGSGRLELFVGRRI